MHFKTRAILSIAAFLVSTCVLTSNELFAQERVRYPVDKTEPKITASFFDDTYPSAYDPPAQHLGVDIDLDEHDKALSPVTGRVIINNTYGDNPFNFYVVIRSDVTGNEHVLGHVRSRRKPGSDIGAGDVVGTVALAGTGYHLHWGINRLSVAAALDIEEGWGFGRAPASATRSEALALGWLDPVDVLNAAKGPQVTRSSWDPAIFAKNNKSLQTRLNDLGFDAGEVDGFPGPQTRSALMRFQAKNCLAVNGQPDPQTSLALAQANRNGLPCASASVPIGVSANEPLVPGMYVRDQGHCDGKAIAYEDYPDSLRIIRGKAITFGIDGNCVTRRTDIRNGVTLFRGTCFDGPTERSGDWTFNLLSPTEFIEVAGYWEGTRGQRYKKCPDTSKLRQEWSSWFQ